MEPPSRRHRQEEVIDGEKETEEELGMTLHYHLLLQVGRMVAT